MKIREAGLDDVHAMAAVQAAAGALAYAGIFDAGAQPPSAPVLARHWATLLAAERSWVGVGEVDGEVIATIAVRAWTGDDLDAATTAEVGSLYVDPRHWGRRGGPALLARALLEARTLGFEKVYLWVLEANLRARGLYADRGWVPDGAWREVAPGVRDLRYRLLTSVTSIEIADLYDEETVARIDARRASASRPRPVSRARQRGVAGALAAAMMMGLREAFDPPLRTEIEQVDPWEGGGTNPWVRVYLDPDPRASIAEVRDR
jgi:GNAT superfamily N-acetyltransferase